MKKIIIFGNGQLGKACHSVFGKEAIMINRSSIDFSDLANLNFNLHMLLDEIHISGIINCMAYTNVDQAESDPLAEIINARALEFIGLYCKSRNIPIFHFSTDFVFDGTKEIPYTEEDKPNPINTYGKTKLLGEEILLNTYDKVMIFRIAWVYSTNFDTNFVTKIITAMSKNVQLSVPNDQLGNLCNVFDLSKLLHNIINKTIQKLDQNKPVNFGIYHISPLGFETRHNIAERILHTLNITTNNNFIKTTEIIPVITSSLESSVQRPLNSRLNSRKFFHEFCQGMPDWCFSLHNATQKIVQRLAQIPTPDA